MNLYAEVFEAKLNLKSLMWSRLRKIHYTPYKERKKTWRVWYWLLRGGMHFGVKPSFFPVLGWIYLRWGREVILCHCRIFRFIPELYLHNANSTSPRCDNQNFGRHYQISLGVGWGQNQLKTNELKPMFKFWLFLKKKSMTSK